MNRSSTASSSAGGAPSPDSAPAIRRDASGGDPPPAWLHRLVAQDLVPRLLDAARRVTPVGSSASADADADVLVDLLLADDADGCVEWVDALSAAGVDADRLGDEVIALAARRLGERWDDDRCDFVQVSIAMGRLQSLVRHVGDDAQCAANGPTGRVLIAMLPGSDHLLGATIVAEAFRRAGWQVGFDPCATEADLLRSAGAVRFDVIGVSVGMARDYPVARALLGALRGASLNRSVSMMAGGPTLRPRDASHAELGADFVPADAREAVAFASRALQRSRDGTDAPATAGGRTQPAAIPSSPSTLRPRPAPGVAATGDDDAPVRRARFKRTAALHLAGTLASLTARAA